MGEYVVKTALHVQPFAKEALLNVVLLRSQVESYANLVYTLMLLQRHESGLQFTEAFVSQAAVGACLRSVCCRTPDTTPLPVTFKDPDVQNATRAAQNTVLPMMSSFHSDKGLVQTMNQSARSFLTVFQNNVFMRLEAWQLRALRAEFQCTGSPVSDSKSKPLVAFICRAAAREINLAHSLDAALYKNEEIRQFSLTDCAFYQEVVARHQKAFARGREQAGLLPQDMSPTSGICTPTLIKKNLHLYLGYALYLQRQIEVLEKSSELHNKRTKLPCQVIPQYTMKLRSVTFGKEQIAEFITALAKNPTLFVWPDF
jgi:hypothetical protein